MEIMTHGKAQVGVFACSVNIQCECAASPEAGGNHNKRTKGRRMHVHSFTISWDMIGHTKSSQRSIINLTNLGCGYYMVAPGIKLLSKLHHICRLPQRSSTTCVGHSTIFRQGGKQCSPASIFFGNKAVGNVDGGAARGRYSSNRPPAHKSRRVHHVRLRLEIARTKH